MRFLLLSAALCSFASFAEECAFDAKDLVPQFRRKLPPGFKLRSTKKEKQHLTQVLTTPEGHEVTLRLGGCAHVAYSFSIKGGTLTPKTVGSELVAVSKRVLPALPMAKDVIADPSVLLRAIDEASIVTLPAQLPCGDATCQLALETEVPAPEKKPKKSKKPAPPAEPVGVLVLSYDFAL